MFATRALTVLVALPIFTAALFFLPSWLWALFLLPALFIGTWEWGGLARYTRAARGAYAIACAASAVALLLFALDPTSAPATPELTLYAVSFACWALIAPLWIRNHWQVRQPILLGIAGWIALVPMWLALVRLQMRPWALLMVLSVIWIADTAAYVAGKRWGRHKLAPVVSPGKSWEGVAGAAAAVGTYYVALWAVVPADRQVVGGAAALALFAILVALSIVGDLFESWMKRQAGVKDSGQLLPGHGGLLDRIDGLTATLPVAALVLHLF